MHHCIVFTAISLLLTPAIRANDAPNEDGHWLCHTINGDPKDHGPDGVTVRDFNADGRPDLLVPFEQGGYSRIYWHPGNESVRDESKWTYIQFPHGGEDAGAGDLDDDGHVDIVLNGGIIYFNPGPEMAASASEWQLMILFKTEARVPIVLDVNNDQKNDLLVAGSVLYHCSAADRRTATNWQRVTLGKTTWAMNAIPHDMDRDGDVDIVVADRNGAGTVWFEHPDDNPLREWDRHIVDDCTQLSFMKVADVDGDGRHDLVITTKRKSGATTQPFVELLRRKNDHGHPTFDHLRIRPPSGDFPKGVNVADYDQDGKNEIFVLPKGSGEWLTEYADEPKDTQDWNDHSRPLEINGWQSRKKMDDVVHIDMDNDGDWDIATTEENSGWGVIWFENPCVGRSNPAKKPQHAGQSGDDVMTAIFDGKTLNGWHAIPKNCASDWGVRNGSIVGRGSADRLAYLAWHDQHLTDFELHLRYRLIGDGNSGVEIRCRPDQSGKRPFEGYHADFGHVGIGPHILGAWDFHFAERTEYPCSRGTRLTVGPDGSFASDKINQPLTLADVRKNGWNDVHIVARGTQFRFYINGKLASEFTDNAKDGRLDDGAIALQIHDRGMTVEFKDVRMKRLTSR
jgi:hypothetical protein